MIPIEILMEMAPEQVLWWRSKLVLWWLEGLALAFEYAAKVATPLQEIRVHADNQAAIYRLHTPSDKPAQTWQLRCIKACKEVNYIGATISIFWVPGHEDVAGNERADALAKQAAMLDFPHTEITSLAMTGMRIKQLARRQWSRVLISATPAAILRNPGTYSAKFAWKSRKKLIISMGTKRGDCQCLLPAQDWTRLQQSLPSSHWQGRQPKLQLWCKADTWAPPPQL
jgi:hypothetical protein